MLPSVYYHIQIPFVNHLRYFLL